LIPSTQQLDLPFASDEHSLKDQLQQLTGSPLCLIITDNATSMLSVQRKVAGAEVRLHRMFLHAGPDICREVAELIRKGRCRRQIIRSFIRQNSHLLKQKSPVVRTQRVTGQQHCLKTMYESLNREYFDGTVSASITWGRSNSRQRVKMRTLGSYHAETNTIRINPLLDKKTVPAYFLEFIVYHEMLHAYVGITTRNGRRSIHSKDFRMHEKKFRYYSEAMEWEKMRFGEKHRRGKDKGQ